MDKHLEAMRRSIGLNRFSLPGVEYHGDRPNLNWPLFLPIVARQLHRYIDRGIIWERSAPRLKAAVIFTGRRAS